MGKEKKEIGIEKLYELLFDYSRNKGYYWTLRQSGKIEGDVRGTDHTLEDEEVSMVIKSKEFGFIKWLVENEKIDFKKIADETYVKVNGELYEVILGCHYDLYQQTLMLLSISDTPIEDLISYLK